MDEVKAIFGHEKQKTAAVFRPAAVEKLVIPRGLEPLLPT